MLGKGGKALALRLEGSGAWGVEAILGTRGLILGRPRVEGAGPDPSSDEWGPDPDQKGRDPGEGTRSETNTNEAGAGAAGSVPLSPLRSAPLRTRWRRPPGPEQNPQLTAPIGPAPSLPPRVHWPQTSFLSPSQWPAAPATRLPLVHTLARGRG